MSIEAHKCNVKGCKGFIVFENADFDITNPPTVNGMYEFHNPTCTECGKEYKVVPHYVVIGFDENGDMEEVQSACITEFERREKERKEETLKDFVEVLTKVEEVQEGQDLTCSCTDCYWNYLESSNQCVSESLGDFKMTPNTTECKGYWER